MQKGFLPKEIAATNGVRVKSLNSHFHGRFHRFLQFIGGFPVAQKTKTIWKSTNTFPFLFIDCKQMDHGEDYMGKRAKTISGKTCQRWDAKSPNSHRYESDFPDGTATKAVNYCRNPGNVREGPWCYLADETGWEYCDIHSCTTTGIIQVVIV